MIRSFLSLAALSMSLTSILAQTNLLLNGDFEADFDNPSDVPSWYEFPTDQNSPQTFIQDFGGEDNSNCLFMGSLTELAGVYQNVTLSPSTRYPLSFSLLVVGNQNRFVVESICGNVNTSLFDDFRLDDTNGEFIRRTVYLTTPSSTSPVNCTVRLLGGASRSSNFLLDNVMLTQPSTLGDPVFVGFNGQVYQVHGIPGRIFNIISTANVQFNAMFQFLAKGDSMTREQMRDVRVRSSNGSKRSHLANRALPVTTAWSHDGSYLGTLAMQFKSDNQVFRLKVVPGAYQSGIASVEVNGQPINLDKSISLIHTNDVKVSLVSKHIIEVVTSEIHLTIVNSDRFFNIQSAQLSSEIQNNPSLIQGVLGQSADASRYFPKYDTATHASSAEKSDWNEHQIMDYLIVDDNLWSSDFHLNQFQ